MTVSLSRHVFLTVLMIVPFANACSTRAVGNVQHTQADSIQEKFAKLESSSGGRIGVSAINMSNQAHFQYRANERFPLCSTGKVMTTAAILKKSEKDPQLLEKHIAYSQKDLDKSGYAPITQKNLTTGMTVAGLSEAAIEYSDNLAMNLLMENLGGPQFVTLFARSIGDNEFRLDRFEPELNSALPGDLRDTSTPAAMQDSLQHLALENELASLQREKLQTWLKNNTTGNARIRAGVPTGWVVGDKTGTGDYGTTNDVGIIWPRECSPIVVAIYFTQNEKNAAPRDDVLAAATRILIDEFSNTDRCIQIKKNRR